MVAYRARSLDEADSVKRERRENERGRDHILNENKEEIKI